MDAQWRHKSKISEKLGRCGRQNMLPPYLKIWEWEWIFGRAVKAISSLGVRSPCSEAIINSSFSIWKKLIAYVLNQLAFQLINMQFLKCLYQFSNYRCLWKCFSVHLCNIHPFIYAGTSPRIRIVACKRTGSSTFNNSIWTTLGTSMNNVRHFLAIFTNLSCLTIFTL